MWAKVCLVYLVCASLGFWEIEAKSLPPYVKPCNRDDPEITKCIVKYCNDIVPHFKNGDEDYKLASISPFRINEAVLQPNSNLKLGVKNVDVYGLDKLKATDAGFSYENNIYNLNLTVVIPQLKLNGDYEIDGKISLLPITGKGKSAFIFDDAVFHMFVTIAEKEKKGVKVINITDVKQTWNVSGINFNFENLFNGDKFLGTEMNKFLNDNWTEVYKELGPSVGEIVANIVLNYVRQVAQNVPVDQVFPHK